MGLKITSIVGADSGPEDNKKKNPAAISEEPGTKTEYRSKSRVLCLTPALSTTKVWAST